MFSAVPDVNKLKVTD